LEDVTGFGVTVNDYRNRTFSATGADYSRTDSFRPAGNHDHFVFELKIHESAPQTISPGD
jgi:hypothetical protein